MSKISFCSKIAVLSPLIVVVSTGCSPSPVRTLEGICQNFTHAKTIAADESKHWDLAVSNVRFDVVKTDSLVAPYKGMITGHVHVTTNRKDSASDKIQATFRLDLAYQDNKWIAVALHIDNVEQFLEDEWVHFDQRAKDLPTSNRAGLIESAREQGLSYSQAVEVADKISKEADRERWKKMALYKLLETGAEMNVREALTGMFASIKELGIRFDPK